MQNTIVYLIGIPAVGKYSTALELARLTGARVIDNHLVNNPVFTALGYDGSGTFEFPEGAWKHIGTIREAVLAVIQELCAPQDSFVFTNVLSADDPADRAAFEAIKALAAARGAAFFPVWLTCAADELRERKYTPERRARLKETDVTTIRWWLDEFNLLRVEHPHALTIDTSHSTPTATAEAIIAHVQRGSKLQ